jgi:hypothetical protein
VLNVKAATFNPNPVPRGALFQPSDAWRDAEPVAPGMMRTGSNRLIAAPLISDPSSPFHSPLGTPKRANTKLEPVRPASRGMLPEDDDDDEFSPFGLPKLHHHEPSGLSTSAKPFEPNASAEEVDPEDDPTQNATLGMTPLDVLTSVFSTVAKRELEDALHRSGYDFEAAMAMLVAQYTHPRSGASTPQRVASPRPMIGIDGRGTNHLAPGQGFFQQGGRGFNPVVNQVRTPGPTRMCRYFLNGECRRSDCRFSHDLDRALCRFWLRGHCAKGPNCEFLHQLPNNLDSSLLNNMGRLDVSSPGGSMPGTPPTSQTYGAVDDFPDLLAARLNRHVGRFDPSRNRFANAVKRPVPAPPNLINVQGGKVAPPGAPGAPGAVAPYSPVSDTGPKPPPVPRPSQRLKLRAPTLLPTLATGTAANDQYMAARATSIRLGHARNACLARAADAFRRGDGAAAKRFSREGKALNEKMVHEANEAAQMLVKERMRDAARAVRERDPAWSDDPRDRAERGNECGAGLGVVLGVAGTSVGSKLSSDERTEALIDLHTLHGTEGAEILGHFLAELERSHYRGLGKCSCCHPSEREREYMLTCISVFVVVGEEKHVGQQDPARGASKVRLASSIKQFLADWGYAWNDTAGGVLCVDPCRT